MKASKIKQKQNNAPSASGKYRAVAVISAVAALVVGLAIPVAAAPNAAENSSQTNHSQTSIVKKAVTAKTTLLRTQTTMNQVPTSLTPGAKAASDRYEALANGRPLPGTDQMQLIMHGYVPPGMPPQQAAMLYNSLPKIPHMQRTGTPEWVSRMAGEPGDPLDGLPMGGLQRNGIESQNQKILEESIRDRFGPIYIPPLKRNHNRSTQSANIRKTSDHVPAQAAGEASAVPVKHFYTRDHLGSIREMTDSSGNIVSQYSYDPYGRQTKISGTGADADFGFEGYYVHQRSGLNLTLRRAYSPVLARFLNRDPIEEAGGINLYAYVGNNPINRFDPTGEQPVTYGNWGGQGRVNGGPGSETSNFPNIGQPGFVKPTTPRDRCYYWHDVCLHNCARIGSSNPKDPKQPQYACDRQRCRKNCDDDLARCLTNVFNTYGNQGFPPTVQREAGGFSGSDPFPGYSGSPNDNPGEFVPGLQPYNQSADPGYQGL